MNKPTSPNHNIDMDTLIQNRRSIGKLSTPTPSMELMQAIIKTAMTAPDHKQLKPWRFVLLTGKSLDDFGQALLQAGQQQALDKGETLDTAAAGKLMNMPKRAPMILVAISDYKSHPKVPKLEQVLSMGACIQNILLLLTANGYQSIWRTGEWASHSSIKTFFGANDDNDIAGFIYIGTSDVVMPARKAIDVADFLQCR